MTLESPGFIRGEYVNSKIIAVRGESSISHKVLKTKDF